MSQLFEPLETHLNRVSRSFSFCIAELPRPLREWVGLSYLLMRVLDTIEDAPWKDVTAQNQAFKDFTYELQSSVSDQALHWQQQVLALPLAQGEGLLLQDWPWLLKSFRELPEAVKAILLRHIVVMKNGMEYFLSLAHKRGELRLSTMPELNRYCFFVAGLVGGLLEELRLLFHSMEGAVNSSQTGESPPNLVPEEERALNLRESALHFGLFLQKVNILKDQKADAQESRHFVFDFDLIFSSLGVHAPKAFHYIEQLPLAQRGYRLFCAWSLFIGLKTLGAIKQKRSKVSRLVTLALIEKIRGIIDHPQKLRKLFEVSLKETFVGNNLAEAINAPPDSEEYPSLIHFFKDYGLRPEEIISLQL